MRRRLKEKLLLNWCIRVLSCLAVFGWVGCMVPSALPEASHEVDLGLGDLDETQVTLQLKQSDLGVLARQSEYLLVQVYPVENGERVVQEGQEFRWGISDDGLYQLEGLKPGLKEFVISLLDASQQELARAVVQQAIGPGRQTLERVVLRAVMPVEVPLQLAVQLNLIDFPRPDSATDDVSLPAPVKSIFANYNCYSCHSSVAVSGGLDLESFPFQRQGESLGNKQALAEFLPVLIGRLESSDLPMPPFGPQPTTEEVSEIETWLSSLSGDQDQDQTPGFRIQWQLYLPDGGLIQTELLNNGTDSYQLRDRLLLETGKSYHYEMQVIDRDGVLWYESDKQELVLPLNGAVALEIDLLYEESVVIIPIEIER
ncbi:MAG: c-type cytochrome [Oligoflexus sp.]